MAELFQKGNNEMQTKRDKNKIIKSKVKLCKNKTLINLIIRL